MSRRIHLLLFDVDGTLLLSGGAGARSLNLAFAALFGHPHAMRRVWPHGKTDLLICQEMCRLHLDREGTTEELRRLMERYVAELPRTVAESRNYHLMPGVPEVLDALAARPDALLGLGTGNFEAGARIKLERGGLNRYFAFGGFGSDATERAALIETGFRRGEALARERAPGAEAVRWVIGDTALDVAAGRACGARTVAVATGGDTLYELAAAAPDHLLADLACGGSIPALLDGAA